MTNRRFVASLLASSALCLIAAPSVRAATDTATSEPAPTVGEVVVTGSALPTTLDAVAVPVSTINAATIAKSGANSDLLQILRTDLPSFAGRSNTGSSNANNTNQNTAGGAQVQLRNLDTLVLINGRRAAVDAIAGIGGKSFVNVDQIPPAAIDRIEVLADGSSAIYGSDAVGGVVNVILKSDYDGLAVGGRYGGASGNYSEQSYYGIGGFNPTPDLNLTIIGSYSSNSPLFQNSRRFSSPFFASSSAIPGTVGNDLLASNLLSPSQANPTGAAATAPNLAALVANGTYLASNPAAIGKTYDLSQFQTLLLKEDQAAVQGSFNLNLVGDRKVVLFGDASASENRSFTQFLPRIATVTVPLDAPFNPVASAVSGVKFGYTPDPKQYFNDDRAVRATIGLKGDFDALGRDWKWETAYVHSQDDLVQQQKNVIYAPNLALAIAGGFNAAGAPVVGGAFSKVFSGFSTSAPLVLQPALDPFARAGAVNPASIANLFGTELINASSVLDSVDAKLTGTLFTLPGGPIGVAVGAGWRREALSAHTDPNGFNTVAANPAAQSWIGGQFNDPFSKARTIGAVFVEVRAPLTSADMHVPGFHEFDFIGAGRYENYSDAGDDLVPKIGFRWQPIDAQLTIRGTYSESFTAPTLFAEYGPTDTRQAGGSIITQAFPTLPNAPFTVEDGNDPQLKPATATSYYLGFVFKPDAVPGLRLTVDYSAVNEYGIAGGIGFVNILSDVNLHGSASPFFNNVAKNNFPGSPGAIGFTNPGDLFNFLSVPGNANNLFAIDRFTNLGGVKARTFNVNLDYLLHTDSYGDFTFDSTAAIFASYKFQALPGQKFYEYAGTSTNGGTGVQGTLPKYRLYSTLDWQMNDWDVTLGNTYIASVEDLGAGGITFDINSNKIPPTASAFHVNDYMTWDLHVSREFKHTGDLLKSFRISGGIDNIGNAMPPLSPIAFTDNNADVATYSPIGRLVYVAIDTKF